MALGLAGQIKQLRNLLAPDSRFNDLAVQFVAYQRSEQGHTFPSGRESKVYGGRWDSWLGRYVDQADEQNILKLPCSDAQLDLILEDKSTVEGAGGRGAGKSEGGDLRAVRHIVERPGERGRILSPTYPLTRIVWGKLLKMVPGGWLLPGKQGIRRSDRELHFVNGSVVKFNSAKDPDSLRSDGFSWTFCDEAQDITTEAVDIAWFCLRDSADPRIWFSLTPKTGEPFDRHQQYMEDPEARCIEFASYSNPFISRRVFDIAAKRMDKRRFGVEVQADWDIIAQMEAEDGPKHVFSSFNRELHALHWPAVNAKDITAQVVRRKIGQTADFIIGVDPNLDWPNYAVVYKVLAPLHTGEPNRWVAIDVISSKGHTGHLGKRIKEAGYPASRCVIIPDASAHYNGLYSSGPKSSARLLRAEGFTVKYPMKNPLVVDSVNDMLAKISPADGDPSWFISLPECDELAEALEAAIWGKTGQKMDKSQGVDHVIDAARYPISYFDPAAKLRRTTLHLQKAA